MWSEVDTVLCHFPKNYKFNETSGNVINVSESAADLGSAADIVVTGATYNQSQLPFGYSMLFDGVNDYAVLSSSLSLWNWIHSTTANYTINYWVRIVSTANNEFLLGTAHTDDAGAGLRHRQNTSNVIDQYMTEGSAGGTVCSNPSATSYFSTGTDYMVTLRYDQSLGTLNAKQRLNDGADTTHKHDYTVESFKTEVVDELEVEIMAYNTYKNNWSFNCVVKKV